MALLRVDFSWVNGKVEKAKINARKDGKCKVLLPAGKSITDAKGKVLVEKKPAATVVSFDVLKGGYYNIL